MLSKRFVLLLVLNLNSCIVVNTNQSEVKALLSEKTVNMSESTYINGNVYDSVNKNKLENVIIKANGREIKTDKNGFYFMSDLPIGKTVITASKKDYTEKIQEVELTNGVKTINFYIESLSKPIESVNVIISTLILQTSNTPVITKKLVKVKGEIKDYINRKPLEGVLVQVGSYSAVTGKDGRFQIDNVWTGTELITISKAGYETISDYLSFAGDFRLDEILHLQK